MSCLLRFTIMIALLSLYACGGGGSSGKNPASGGSVTLGDTQITVRENDDAGGALLGQLNMSSNGDVNIESIDVIGDGAGTIYISDTGDIRLSNNFSFNYEERSLYTLTITVNIIGKAPVTGQLVITVEDVSEGPHLGDKIFSVDENSNLDTPVGSVVPAANTSAEFTDYVLSGADAASFSIDEGGYFSFSSNTGLDYETQTLYNFSVTATNNYGESSTALITVNINDLPEQVAILGDTLLSIPEGSSPGTYAGSIEIVSNGDSPINLIEISGERAEDFVISSTGRITVAEGALLDFETFPSYTLQARAHNAAGVSGITVVSIQLSDVDAPPVLADTVLEFNEHMSSGSYIGQIDISAQGEHPIDYFLLEGNGSNLFRIDRSGRVSAAFSKNFDTQRDKDGFQLKVQAYTAGGNSNIARLEVQLAALPADVNAEEVSHLVPSDPDTTDAFGSSVALLDGDVLIGSPRDDYDNHGRAGSVYRFRPYRSASPTEVKLQTSSSLARSNNEFGNSLSAIKHPVHNHLLAIGAQGMDPISGTSNRKGRTWIYQKDKNGSMQPRLYVALSDEERDGALNIGATVTLSEQYFLTQSGNQFAGQQVFLFNYDQIPYPQLDNAPAKPAELLQAIRGSSSSFGNAIATDGNYFTIAAYGETYNTPEGQELWGAGKVYLYIYDPIAKDATKLTGFNAPEPKAQHLFGTDIAMGNGYILVSNQKNQIHLYKRNSDDSVTHLQTITHPSEGSGNSRLKLVGNRLVASNGKDAIHVYAIANNELVFKQTIHNKAGTGFGQALDFDGRYLAVGAKYENFVVNPQSIIKGTGAAYVYDLYPDYKPDFVELPKSIALEDNIYYDNLFEFEPQSPAGGPFSYTLGGEDAQHFTLVGNTLAAVTGLSSDEPADTNKDNQYSLLVTLTDSAGESQQFSLVVDINKGSALIIHGQTTEPQLGGTTAVFGIRIYNHGDLFLVQSNHDDFYENNNGDQHEFKNIYRSRNSHIYRQQLDGSLSWVDSIIAPSIDIPNNIAERFDARTGEFIAINESFVAVSAQTTTGRYETTLFNDSDDLVSHTAHNFVDVYRFDSNGELGAPVRLATSEADQLRKISSLTAFGEYLLVGRRGYNWSMQALSYDDYKDLENIPFAQSAFNVATWGISHIDDIELPYTARAESQVFPASDMLAYWGYTGDFVDDQLVNVEEHTKILRLNVDTEQFEQLTELDISLNRDPDYMPGDNLLLRNPGNLSQGIPSRHHMYALNNNGDGVEKVMEIDTERLKFDFEKTFYAGNYVIYKSDSTLHLFRLNDSKASEYLGTATDENFENIFSVNTHNGYFYFGVPFGANSEGRVVIFKLKDNLRIQPMPYKDGH